MFSSVISFANNIPKRIYYTCNPGGQGHQYIKRLFIDKRYEDGECMKIGVAPTVFTMKLGYSDGAFSYWNKKNKRPDEKGIAKIAEALGLTKAQLLEGVDDVPMVATITGPGKDYVEIYERYTAQEEEIIKTYRKLSARQQAKFLNFIFELEEQPQ